MPAKKQPTAPACADVAPPQSISKMIGLLKYQKSHGKDKERSELACQAHAVYSTLTTPQERALFVQDFEANGNGKTANGLKFALTFKKTLSSRKNVEVGSHENMLTRPFSHPHTPSPPHTRFENNPHASIS